MKGRNMVMVTTRPNTLQHSLVNCIICGEPIKPDQATSGSLYANDQQAYACSTHLRRHREWVPAWATFETTQQQLRKNTRGQAQ